MLWQSAMSAVSSPARSPPNTSPLAQPLPAASMSRPAASRGVSTGSWVSRGRAVVASTRRRSAIASSRLGNTRAPSSGQSAPEAEAQARACGQPSLGRTRRRSSRPKLPITRATAPMFSASCGSTRMTAGAFIGARLRIGPVASAPQPASRVPGQSMTVSRRALAVSAGAALAACGRKPLIAGRRSPPLDVKRLNDGFPALVARARPGIFSAGVTNLETGQTWYWNMGRPFPLAGAAALPLAAAALAAIEARQLALSERVTFSAVDLSAPFSAINRKWPTPPDGYSASIPVSTLLTLALIWSDNTAADVLAKRIGGPSAVNAFLDEKGATDVRIDRYAREVAVESAGMPTFRPAWKDEAAF